MDSLVRKALLGDREAQRECTEKGNVQKKGLYCRARFAGKS